MEKNIHDDRLDDYVKKSFEEYEEDPALDMWDRIEVQLPPAPKAWWLSWRSYRWQLAAAAVIMMLVSRLVCVQYYCEDKMRALTQQQSNSVIEKKPGMTTPPVIAPSKSVPESQSSRNVINPENQAYMHRSEAKNASNSHQQPSNTLLDGIKSNEPTTARPITKQEHIEERLVHAPELIRLETAPTQASSVIGMDSLSENSAGPVKPANLPWLEPANKALIYTFREAHPALVPSITKKFSAPSGWYVGLYITPHLVVEAEQKRPVRPGPGGNLRHLYANRQERPKLSAEVSLRFGKKITGRFAVETGLGFQQFSRTATHRPWFQYREGQPIQTPGSEARSFDYDLNTYGGSASVSLRAEVSGSDVPSETERVAALITSREQIQMLRIPVVGVARLGHGRVQAVIKAGVQGSYLIKNSFEISAYALENNKLRPRANESFTVTYDRPKHFILGYQASVGAEFRVNKHLSLAGAPTLSGDFPRSDPQRGKLPGHTTVGVNVGANWWF